MGYKLYKIYKIKKRQDITQLYEDKNRFIPQDIYMKLKNKKICDHCHKSFEGNKRPEIHHIIPKKYGGTNDESNLMAVHKKCHDYLDEQYEVEYEKTEIGTISETIT